MTPESPSTDPPTALLVENDCEQDGESEAPEDASTVDGDVSEPEEVEELEPLPRTTRIVLLVLGTVFLLLGIAGLALPFLQGILFIAIGLALLSLGSARIESALLRRLESRPTARRHVLRFRRRMHARLHRRGSDRKSSASEAADS